VPQAHKVDLQLPALTLGEARDRLFQLQKTHINQFDREPEWRQAGRADVGTVHNPPPSAHPEEMKNITAGSAASGRWAETSFDSGEAESMNF